MELIGGYFPLHILKMSITKLCLKITKFILHPHHSGYCDLNDVVYGLIRLSVSTVNRTYEHSGITHVTPFRICRKHLTEFSTCGPWVRTYSKLFSCESAFTVCSCRAQSMEIYTYGRVSRGSLPRVCRYGLLYLWTVKYEHHHPLNF